MHAQPSIYVLQDWRRELAEGELGTACMHGEGAHLVLVCVHLDLEWAGPAKPCNRCCREGKT